MQSIIQTLTALTAQAFADCGYDAELGNVSVSDRLDLCQFQCNGAFDGAKRYKKAPLSIAQEVAARLEGNTIFAHVEAVRPGFLNLTVTDAFLLEHISAIAEDASYGVAQADTSETIVIDYGGPNVAKPLHIGHLRAAIIGESLKRIARFTGRKVIGDVHLGDWGLQMGLVMAEYETRNPDWPCFRADFDPDRDSVPSIDMDELNEIYPFASKKSKEDPVFSEKAHAVTQALQNGHPGYTALWKAIMRVSVADLKANYEKLNVTFDLWYGESDAEKYVPELLEILRAKHLIYESDGAQIVDVAEETDKAPVPPIMIKKSDNSNMYSTTDLATILQRQKDFAPARIWYVVDQRQSLHFTQVFRCAKKAGLVPSSTELSHLGFGTMNGSDGKPYKTRDGGVMRLSDLLETVIGAAKEKISQSQYITDDQKEDTARKIGVAAVKFGDLVNHRTKDYVFDIDKFLSFEGKTGPYILYTISRINSILRKADVQQEGPLQFHGIYSDLERELYLNMALTGEVFTRALQEKAPNFICENAFKLASLFSAFYHETHIASESDPVKQTAWISLCKLVRQLLTVHMNVLGIDTVDSM